MRKFLMTVFLLWASAAMADPPEVVFLGDSLTAGYGLPQDQGLVPQMQAWVEAQGAAARLVNAGVSGDTTAGAAARIGWALGPGADALVVTLGGNDFLRGIAPEVAETNLRAILDTARQAGLPVLLVGMKAPPNYGPDYEANFDAIYPRLSREFSTLYYPSLLRPLSEASGERGDALAFLQPDGLHPTREGVALVVEGLGPSVLELIAQAGDG